MYRPENRMVEVGGFKKRFRRDSKECRQQAGCRILLTAHRDGK